MLLPHGKTFQVLIIAAAPRPPPPLPPIGREKLSIPSQAVFFKNLFSQQKGSREKNVQGDWCMKKEKNTELDRADERQI